MKAIVIFLFASSPTLLNAGWTTQSSGTTNLLYSVHFADENNGWAVGRNGTILHTTNGGNNWVSQVSGTTAFLHTVYFTDRSNGWVVGGSSVSGIILHTTNGGDNWEVRADGGFSYLQAVYFTNRTHGCAVGYVGVVLQTTDGGAQWVRRQSDTFSWLRAVHFSDKAHGWAVGAGGGITHTTNHGKTWTAQSSGLINDLNSVFFVDSNNGWVVGGYPNTGGHILHTTDGGDIWSEQSWSGDWLYSVCFTNESTGWAVGINGTIASTTDAGNTWTLDSTVTSEWLWSVQFIDENTGWAVGDGGTILRYSTDSSEQTSPGITPRKDNRELTERSTSGLEQNFPNPFNPSTVIRFQVEDEGWVSLTVFDLLGRTVATLADERLTPGQHTRAFNAVGLPSGVYFYRLKTPSHSATRKLLLLY
jgi:photosystem II stability/assembly factor-like uncharacterized protein